MPPDPMLRALRRYAPVVFAVAMLAVVTLVTATSHVHLRAANRAPGFAPTAAPTIPPAALATPMAGPPTTPGPVPAGTSALLRILLVLLVLAIIALVVGVVIRLARRSGRPGKRRVPSALATAPGSAPAASAVLDAAVTAGLVDLADDSDPRGAVINAWVRLERVADRVGTTRTPSDTPGDLVARLLAAYAVPADVLTRLAALYRTARYSPRPVDDSMREEAFAALGAVQDALRQPVPSA